MTKVTKLLIWSRVVALCIIGYAFLQDGKILNDYVYANIANLQITFGLITLLFFLVLFFGYYFGLKVNQSSFCYIDKYGKIDSSFFGFMRKQGHWYKSGKYNANVADFLFNQSKIPQIIPGEKFTFPGSYIKVTISLFTMLYCLVLYPFYKILYLLFNKKDLKGNFSKSYLYAILYTLCSIGRIYIAISVYIYFS